MSNSKTKQSLLIKSVLFLPRLVFAFCYGVGWLILSAVKLLWPSVRIKHKINRKLWSLRQLRLGFTLLTFIVMGAAIVASFQLASLVASGQHIAGKVLGVADEGVSHIAEAQQALNAQDANAASDRLALALQSFEQSRTNLNSNSKVLQGLLNLVPQKQDADQLLQASILLTQAGQEWTEFYKLSQTVKITPQGITGENLSPEVLKQMNEHLQSGRNKTNQALSLLGEVDPGIIPGDKQATFIQLKNNLGSIQTAVNSVGEVFNLLYNIIAGQKNILFIFENSNELRATGGFIGTFGAMRLSNGQITDLHISSIYDLDGQLKDKIAPPRPLLTIIPQWYMRDSNWFTDFPTSAQIVSRFYEKEGGQTPDMVIALTPQFIIDWLKVTGPIYLSRYNTTFTADNFIEQAQFESSVNYDKTLNQPKQILADFFPAFLQQIGTLSGPQLLPIVAGLQKNLAAKNILLYSRNPDLQSEIEKFNWAGRLRTTDRDYLLVSSNNLGGTKTDNTISQNIKLTSSINTEGHVFNTLQITKSNPLPDKPEFLNHSFMRIYAPLGSKLITAQGFTQVDPPYNKTLGLTFEPEVSQWEESFSNDPLSGTLIGTESGKTIFANWLDLKGGESKTITLTYELPFTIQNIDHYSLLLQKQPGTTDQTFDYHLGFDGRQSAWQNFRPKASGTSSLDDHQIFSKDLFLGLSLQTQ